MERRQEYFKIIEVGNITSIHLLIQLAKDCLNNKPSRRPSAEQLLCILTSDGADGPRREFEKRVVVRQMKKLKPDDEVQRAVQEECQKLYAELAQQKDEEVRSARMEVYDELQRKNFELSQKDQEIQLLHAIIENECRQRSKMDNYLQECMQLQEQMREKHEQLEKQHQMEQQKLYMELQRTRNEKGQ